MYVKKLTFWHIKTDLERG